MTLFEEYAQGLYVNAAGEVRFVRDLKSDQGEIVETEHGVVLELWDDSGLVVGVHAVWIPAPGVEFWKPLKQRRMRHAVRVAKGKLRLAARLLGMDRKTLYRHEVGR